MTEEHRGALYITSTRLEELRRRLSARDLVLLAFINQHGYATTTQLRRMFFAAHATLSAGTRACIRVLDRLLAHQLVTRLDRRVGGNPRGSAAYIWHLDIAGERLTRRPGAARRRFTDPSLPFVEHSLEVAEAHVTLHELASNDEGPALARIEIESEAWRHYLAASGATSILKPDLSVTLSTPDYDDHWYIEIDRGTESLPVLLIKSRAYAAYRRTGRAQAEHGVFPRVLWVVPTQRRVARLTAAIAADPDLPDRLFVAITPEQLRATVRDPPDSQPVPRRVQHQAPDQTDSPTQKGGTT